jgi:hypothetical protein
MNVDRAKNIRRIKNAGNKRFSLDTSPQNLMDGCDCDCACATGGCFKILLFIFLWRCFQIPLYFFCEGASKFLRGHGARRDRHVDGPMCFEFSKCIGSQSEANHQTNDHAVFGVRGGSPMRQLIFLNVRICCWM